MKASIWKASILDRRPGLSLVELLIAIVLGATASLVTVQVTRQIMLMTTHGANRTLAWERGQAVLSILESRVRHAGLGLTYERAQEVFSKSFGGARNDSPLPWQRGAPPFSSHLMERGPLHVLRGSLLALAPLEDGVRRGRGLIVLYSVPSALVAQLPDNKPVSMDAPLTDSAYADVAVTLVPAANRGMVNDRLSGGRSDIRSWVVFPLSKLPAQAAAYNSGTGVLTVRLAY